MSGHRAVIETGPRVIRRLCCGAGADVVADAAKAGAALECIDDPVALVDARPVPVDALWRAVLGSLRCGRRPSVLIVHPSWWGTARVERVVAAAGVLADEVVAQPRSWLLARATAAAPSQPAVVVEIAESFVVVSGAAVVAEGRRAEPGRVAEAVARAVVAMAPAAGACVLVDETGDAGGAAALAAMIVDAVRDAAAGLTVMRVDDVALQRLAAAVAPAGDPGDCGPSPASGRRRRRVPALAVALAVLAASVAGVVVAGRHRVSVPAPATTTFLVEGRVALEVPADWPVRRVTAGPGSARVTITSPSDPEIMLHVTQSPGESLRATAEALRHAIDGQRPGVFVDFNPSGLSAGRPAVTYREVRAGHDIWWTVLLAGSVRISVGCQSRPRDEQAVRVVCERAIRSARVLH